MDKYRIQYRYKERNCLSLKWAFKRDDFQSGDFYIKALKESTNVDEHNRDNNRNHIYTDPMSLENARSFIEKIDNGSVRDCMGLTLEDELTVVDFEEPIQIRNIKRRRTQ